MNRSFWVPPKIGAVQIDDFPAECARGSKGALYVRPNAILVLTPGEWEHLESRYAKLAARLVDLTVEAPAPVARAIVPEVEPSGVGVDEVKTFARRAHKPKALSEDEL